MVSIPADHLYPWYPFVGKRLISGQLMSDEQVNRRCMPCFTSSYLPVYTLPYTNLAIGGAPNTLVLPKLSR